MRLSYFRPLERGGASRRYAEKLRAMRHKSGVYVIRQLSDRRVLYVGESHRGRLYDTCTRHFRTWEGPTAGYTVQPERVEIAVVQVPPTSAVAAQNALIRRLRPYWNTYGMHEEAAPF